MRGVRLVVGTLLMIVHWAHGETNRPTEPILRRLDEAMADLTSVRETITAERVPLARELSRLEDEHLRVRRQYDAARKTLDQKSLERSQVVQETRRLEQEQAYLINLFSEYARNFEGRLHLAEVERYRPVFTPVQTTADAAERTAPEAFAASLALVQTSFRRLEELLGGATMEGRAVAEDGTVAPGRFVLLGPVVYFAADATPLAGVVEQRLGSTEPTVFEFARPEWAESVRSFVAAGAGTVPVDPTLGLARKIERTQETLVEHIRKGGPVMVPILTLAALIALVAMVKAFTLLAVRVPHPRSLQGLLDAVRRGDCEAARAQVARIRGVGGKMLAAGVAAIGGSRDLIEDAMYEQVLAARFRFHRGLPLIAVGAATAPLLGLLGTVTGIISTFKLITVFGAGDVKMLSSGISEALITTEFGLLVAIPSLLIHALLSRRARALVDRMEQLAVMFLGATSACGTERQGSVTADAAAVATVPLDVQDPVVEEPMP